MASIVVTTLNDVVDAGDGVISMREALVLANSTAAADVITFDASLAGGTIVLAGTELAITEDVTIDGDMNGDDKADITISGNNVSRVFNITGAGTDVYALSLDIADGQGGVNGGAIAAGAGTFLGIADTTVRDSYSVLNGGGIDAFGGLLVVDSTISGNSTNSYGGGVYVRAGASGTFINTTIDNNMANLNGGGIATGSAADLVIQNSTITDNTAVVAGGGIDLFSGSTARIENTVVGLNTGSNINDHDVNENGAASTVTAQNSFFSSIVGIDIDNGGNFNNLGDPSLGALADNGGTVQTRNITASSPLINAGDNALVPGGVNEDANGNQRINAGTVDIGATEFFLKVTTSADEAVNGSLAFDAADGGGLSLREAIAHANVGETISFDDSLAGQTIVLTGTELALGQSVGIDGDIDGDNRADITIDAAGASRIFNIRNDGTDVVLRSLNLINGYSATYGGAIIKDDNSSLTVVDSTLSGNEATIFGGALASFGGSVNFFNSLLTDNHMIGGGAGGAVYVGAVGTINLTNTTVFGNSAGGYGGGISLFKATLGLFNSTVAGNHGNTADADATQGGGISTSLSSLNLYNSVVAENTSGTAYAGDDVRGTIDNATNSFFGTLEAITAGPDNTNGGGDPLLGQLLDNGGTTLTLSPLDGSALIDGGNNATIPFDAVDLDDDGILVETISVDGRAGARIVGGTVDIGAVEQIVDEIIGGTAGDDNIVGGLGNDTATYKDAAAGVTQYLLFTGLDTGGAGTDTLSGIENLTGSAFDDRLVGDGNDNVLTGGDGIDILKGKGGNDTFFGGAGNDKMTGGAGDDIMFGGAGNDRLIALDGLDMLNGGDDDDFLFGGKDSDILNGDAGADNIRGNLGVDVLNGGTGSDTLRGGGSNDTLNGGDDNDFLFGENHSDILFGGAGNDSLTGGLGLGAFDGFTDTFIYKDTVDGGGGFDRIKDFENGIDVMDLQSFGFANFAAVQALASDTGLNMRINFGGGDVLFVENFQVADFDVGDVLI